MGYFVLYSIEESPDCIQVRTLHLTTLSNKILMTFINNGRTFHIIVRDIIRIMNRKEEPYSHGYESSSAIIIEEHSPLSHVPVKKYSKGKMLGKGGFAKCYEFTSLDTKRVYAAKIIDKSTLVKSNAKQKLTSEIKIHKSLKYQYIVGFEHFFEDQNYVYILLQLCPHQTLNQLIKRRKRVTEIQAQCYLYQIALALKYLHNNRVIHRDLKLGNLFLSDKLEIKIGDFGLAAKLENDNEKRRTMCGTPNYIAPQILENKTGHSYEADVWSFGVIAYAMLIGKPPFQTNDVKTTYKKIRMCNYSFPDSIQISKTAKNFISKMLQLDPARRMTVDQILNHQFFTTNSFPKTLPVSTLACPPNANFIKQFKKQVEEQPERLGMMGSKYGLSTDRIQSIPKENLLASKNRNNTEQEPEGMPPRAASSAALVNHHKLAMLKKKDSFKESAEQQRHGPEIWVTQYDNNPRFGMSYLLNCNISGMNFNDKTCLISNPNYSKVKYMERIGMDEQAAVHSIDHQSIPGKKMKLLNHFNKILRQKRDQTQNKMSYEQVIRNQKLKYKKDTDFKCYVSKYLIVPKASFFWFINKDLQVIFQDGTEVLIRQEQAVYVNKFSERRYFMFNDYETMGEEIKKRIKYINEIIKTSRTSSMKPESNQNVQSVGLGGKAEHGHSKSNLRNGSSKGRFLRSQNN